MQRFVTLFSHWATLPSYSPLCKRTWCFLEVSQQLLHGLFVLFCLTVVMSQSKPPPHLRKMFSFGVSAQKGDEWVSDVAWWRLQGRALFVLVLSWLNHAPSLQQPGPVALPAAAGRLLCYTGCLCFPAAVCSGGHAVIPPGFSAARKCTQSWTRKQPNLNTGLDFRRSRAHVKRELYAGKQAPFYSVSQLKTHKSCCSGCLPT